MVQQPKTWDLTWDQALEQIESLAPDDKQFLMTEAAQDLLFGKLPAPPLAKFVGDVILDNCNRKSLRGAAREIQAGRFPQKDAAEHIAQFLLKPRYRGRRPSDTPKDLKIFATCYLRAQTGHCRGRIAIGPRIMDAVSKELRHQGSDAVRKAIAKYRPLAAYLNGRDPDESRRYLLALLTERARPRRDRPVVNQLPSDRAAALLTEVLSRGSMPVEEIRRRARAADISPRTLNRIKERLGIRSERAGKVWSWALPSRVPNN